ncbi:hypothetical protein QJS10_CPB17g01888 [Acorus calamus]|uniref:Uncharacterized protein n=1 Tax=Acorus calamus TaxID=4465 RepID=A0AAV9CS77_ACOCL|nr:hypothetical protein QJS10_CPB17g01888 [Acorus calamus]
MSQGKGMSGAGRRARKRWRKKGRGCRSGEACWDGCDRVEELRTKRKGGKKQENEGELPSATDAASTSSIAAIDTFKAAGGPYRPVYVINAASASHVKRSYFLLLILKPPEAGDLKLVIPSKAADWYSDKMGCCAVEALRSANRCELLEIGDGGSGGGGGAHMSGLS